MHARSRRGHASPPGGHAPISRVRRWCPQRDSQEVGRLWQEFLLSAGLTSAGTLGTQGTLDTKDLLAATMARLQRAAERKIQAARECRGLVAQLQQLQHQQHRKASQDVARLGQQVPRLKRQRMWACLVVEPPQSGPECPPGSSTPAPDDPAAADDPPHLLAGYILLSITQPLALLPPPFPSSAPHVLHVDALVVDARWRRRGMATQLLQAAERLALRWRQRSLYLEVDATNQPAVQLYCDKLGFRVAKSLGWPWRRTRKLILWKHVSAQGAGVTASSGVHQVGSDGSDTDTGSVLRGAAVEPGERPGSPREPGVYVWEDRS